MRFGAAILLIGMATTVSAEDVAGFGPTIDDARNHARQKALKILKDRLAEHDPPLTAWEPTLRDVDAMLDGPGHAGRSEFVEPVGLQHQMILSVVFPGDDELMRRNRQSFRGKAMVWWLLAISVAMVGVALWKRK